MNNSLDTNLPVENGPVIAAGCCIEFEGVPLPVLMRPRMVQAVFQIGHGTLYTHLNAGRIRSIAVKGVPNQRRATRLIYTQSIIDFLRGCERV